MLNAFASAASAFRDALPQQVPLKDSIRKELEGDITVDEVIRCKKEMIALATSDDTGETTFDMVHADRAKFCKDKEAGESLDQIDFSYRYIILIGVVWIICAFIVGVNIVEMIEAVCSVPLSERALLNSIYTIIFPLTMVFVGSLYFEEHYVRCKSYEKALRERIILDRIKK